MEANERAEAERTATKEAAEAEAAIEFAERQSAMREAGGLGGAGSQEVEEISYFALSIFMLTLNMYFMLALLYKNPNQEQIDVIKTLNASAADGGMAPQIKHLTKKDTKVQTHLPAISLLWCMKMRSVCCSCTLAPTWCYTCFP